VERLVPFEAIRVIAPILSNREIRRDFSSNYSKPKLSRVQIEARVI
jgi:hypothetical protein